MTMAMPAGLEKIKITRKRSKNGLQMEREKGHEYHGFTH